MSRIEIVLAVVRCDGQICLARRSMRVATSRGLWSVVTGYLEPETDPLSQAWTELDEELGLGAHHLRLVRRLEPVPLTSAGSGKQFLVYPFLFDSQHVPALVLNWEHDKAQWADPSRLDAPDCVSWQLPLVRALLADG
jgi:8-oxo-dGTP pyrophosphatase MutT (NUDIX family)